MTPAFKATQVPLGRVRFAITDVLAALLIIILRY